MIFDTPGPQKEGTFAKTALFFPLELWAGMQLALCK